MKNKKIIIVGGTGFIGQGLAERWAKENHVIILSRQTATAINNSYGHRLTETELLLKSRWVLPTKLLATGFRFNHPRLGPALETIINH